MDAEALTNILDKMQSTIDDFNDRDEDVLNEPINTILISKEFYGHLQEFYLYPLTALCDKFKWTIPEGPVVRVASEVELGDRLWSIIHQATSTPMT